MDYDALLSPWRRIFGRENLIVRRFEPSDFTEGDLLADFASAIPFELSGLNRGKSYNLALSAPALAFLREFNKRLRPRIDAGEDLERGAN